MSVSSSNIAFAYIFCLEVQNNRGASTETLNDDYPSNVPVKSRILSSLVGALFKVIPQAVRTIPVIHHIYIHYYFFKYYCYYWPFFY